MKRDVGKTEVCWTSELTHIESSDRSQPCAMQDEPELRHSLLPHVLRMTRMAYDDWSVRQIDKVGDQKNGGRTLKVEAGG